MRFSRHLIGSLAAAAILAPSLAHADTTAPKWYDKITLGGYAEANYQMWLNQPSGNDWQSNGTSTDPNTTIPYRVFDGSPNTFQYNGEVTLKYADSASNTGAFIDLVYGPMATIINNAQEVYQENWWANGYSGVNSTNFLVGQAYLDQAFGPLTFTLGKFATPIGYESWNVTANANFSRGLLYSQEPFYSLGAKLDYAAPMAITGSLWVDNGNSFDNTYNDAKNFGAEVAYAGVKNLNIAALYYRDVAGTTQGGGPYSPTDYYDLTGSYTVSDALSFGAEYLHKESFPYTTGTQTSSVQQGYALYSTYTIAGLNISPRFEQYFVPDGGGYNGASKPFLVGPSATKTYELTDYTLTLKYPMGPITHILEYRADASNAAEFYTSGDASYKATQLDQTATYAATYSF